VKSSSSKRRVWCGLSIGLLLASSVCWQESWAQAPKAATKSQPAQSQLIEPPQDSLGRTTPRGTVLGFLTAAYSRNYDTAAQYLNTRLRGKEAAAQAEQLFFVLDRRLPAKLNNLSNEPQGSLSDPLDSRRELVGTVASANGKIDIYIERVDLGNATPIWLFSRQTLASVPDLYEEINAVAVENVMPEYLLERYFGFSLFGWLFFFVALPLLYLLLSLASRLLGAVSGYALRRLRKQPDLRNPKILPHPVRLLIVGVGIHWTLSKFSLSLLARQIGSIALTVVMVVALVWLLVLLNGHCESYFKKRMEQRGRLGSTAIVRPLRRVMDIFAVVVGLIFALHSFGINPSAALAGLGVGGIAVALAAQKTLENVIGGASIILDEAVRVGDFFKMGDVIGTVEEIGLRSTRVRTLDRTLVTIPNGQMAIMTLENFSSRDSYWFHHVIGLRYETSSASLNTVLESVRKLLEHDRRVLLSSPRVRFLRFAESSLELEIFAYVSALGWGEFLRIQEDLLLQIREAITSAGGEIAFPSRAIYVKNETESDLTTAQPGNRSARAGKT